MRRRSRAASGGPPSITCPTPLNTRPRIDGATPNDNGSPKKRTTVPESVRPAVASSTSIVITSLSIAATRPRRGPPSVPCTSTASASPTSSVRRRNRSGPSSRAAAPSDVRRIVRLLALGQRLELVLDRFGQPGKARKLGIADVLAHAAAAAARIAFARYPSASRPARARARQGRRNDRAGASSRPAAPASKRGRCPSTRTGAGTRR